MLNSKELYNYRKLRGVTQTEVAENCNVSRQLITLIENGDRKLNAYSHREIVSGINKAYQKKKKFEKDNPPKPQKTPKAPKRPKKPRLKNVVKKKKTKNKEN